MNQPVTKLFDSLQDRLSHARDSFRRGELEQSFRTAYEVSVELSNLSWFLANQAMAQIELAPDEPVYQRAGQS